MPRWQQRAIPTASSGTRGPEFWRPEQGETLLRIYPFRHVVQEGDFALGLYLPGEAKVGNVEEELFHMFRAHFEPKPYHICGLIRKADGRFTGECQTCDDARMLDRTGNAKDREDAKRRFATQRYAFNVVLSDRPYDGFLMWGAPKSVAERILDLGKRQLSQGRNIFGSDGLDLELIFDNNKPGRDKYSVSLRFPDQCQKLDPPGEPTDMFTFAQIFPEPFHCYLGKPEEVAEPAPTTDGGAEDDLPIPPTKGKAKKPKPLKTGAKVLVSFGDEQKPGVVTGTKDDGSYAVKTDDDGKTWSCTSDELVLQGD